MDEIKLLLRNTHDFEAERKFLLSKLEDCNGRVNEQIKHFVRVSSCVVECLYL